MMNKAGPPKVENYSFGSIRIDGRSYSSDVIIYPDKITDWWRKQGHLLQTADIETVLTRNPDTLVVGTGYSGMMQVSPEVEKICVEREIGLIIRRTTEAWQIYNRLSLEEKQTVIAAFHLTC